MKHSINLLVVVLFLLFSNAFGQPKYRTFNQSDLAQKKGKPGKALSSSVCFTFRNDSTGITVNSLHARLNSAVISIVDSGGFTTFTFNPKKREFDATGRTVAAGDSVTLCFHVEKKAPGTHANFWWWDTNGVLVGTKRTELAANSDSQIVAQPNGGNVREYLYKRVIRRPAGVIVGLPTDTPDVGWIRYKTADRKYFPHTGSARCFDRIATGRGGDRDFDGELKNPHVKKHNNHLLGELHSLKLAIIANDSGVTEPLDTTALGNLIYNDTGNSSDPCNNLTLRQLVHLIDSALTYCTHFDSVTYVQFDSCVTRINRAFDGPYMAVTLSPLLIAGTHSLGEVSFIHPNPSATPKPSLRYYGELEDLYPASASLGQNYPNPFNPTTTISFYLPEASIVSLKIYNILGQEVATLFDKVEMEEGEETVEFDAALLTSGVYFYKITAEGFGETRQQFQSIKRMLLLK
ncbi:MAG: T9SS type A sorting domain-containing protein [Ignavibacteriae bacterium]|nr:T9SS type A sorting domain-containing protein [Ignavibacteriota bacterium]